MITDQCCCARDCKIGYFDSAQDTFDVLTQGCMLKVLEPLLLCILESFQKADTGLDLG